MQAFKYKGYDTYGEQVSGEVIANSLDDAERRLALQNVTIIAILPKGRANVPAGSAAGSRAKRGRGMPEADAAVVLRNLATMAETGVPFVESLDSCALSARTPAVRAQIEELRGQVVAGQSVSAAMQINGMFPTVVAEMIRVAEEGGRLDQSLDAAATFLERSVELRKRVMNAMMYPFVTIGVAVLTVAALILFVLPKFAPIFERMKDELPLTTTLMLAIGEATRENPIVSILVLVVVCAGSAFAIRTPAVAQVLNRVVRRLPGLGPLLRHLSLSRACQSIAVLTTSNVPLLSALEHGAKVSGDPAVHDGLVTARNLVEQGQTLADALAISPAFPPLLVQVVAVGERTGRLGPLLANYTHRMEHEIDARLKALVALLEPLMIVIMGIIVGAITLSIILPIYSMTENVR
jgi:type II secretory pathway component PulF